MAGARGATAGGAPRGRPAARRPRGGAILHRREHNAGTGRSEGFDVILTVLRRLWPACGSVLTCWKP